MLCWKRINIIINIIIIICSCKQTWIRQWVGAQGGVDPGIFQQRAKSGYKGRTP